MRQKYFGIFFALILLFFTACAPQDTSAAPSATDTTPQSTASNTTAPQASDPGTTVPQASEPGTSATETTAAATSAPDSSQTAPPQSTAPGSEPLSTQPAAPAAMTCTLKITCMTLLDNLDSLSDGVAKLVPESGVIFDETAIAISEGDSVFDVLKRELKSAKMHFEFVNTPALNTVYIEGIANIYEFDCGDLSGWTYKVNGQFPGYGCSQYMLSDGDSIEWLYTCDLGRDVGSTTGTLQ